MRVKSKLQWRVWERERERSRYLSVEWELAIRNRRKSIQPVCIAAPIGAIVIETLRHGNATAVCRLSPCRRRWQTVSSMHRGTYTFKLFVFYTRILSPRDDDVFTLRKTCISPEMICKTTSISFSKNLFVYTAWVKIQNDRLYGIRTEKFATHIQLCLFFSLTMWLAAFGSIILTFK